MYAIYSCYRSYEDKGIDVDFNVEIVKVDKMRMFCLEKIVACSAPIAAGIPIYEDEWENCVDAPYRKYIPFIKHAHNELICIKKGDDPKKIITYEENTVPILIENLLKIGKLMIKDGYGWGVTNVIFGETLSMVYIDDDDE